MSYSLYLYHLPIFWITHDYLVSIGIKGRSLWVDALQLTCVVALALLTFRAIELPLLRFKDRFSYARHGH